MPNPNEQQNWQNQPRGQYPNQPPQRQKIPNQQYPQQPQNNTQYPQQQNQYPQQNTAQQQTPQPIVPKNHKTLIIIVGILLIISIATGVFIALTAEEKTTIAKPLPTLTTKTDLSLPAKQTSIPLTTTQTNSTTTTKTPTTTGTATKEELKIDKLVFASMIYDNLTYIPRKNNEFFSVEPIYIYTEPTGFTKTKTNAGYTVDLTQDLEVVGPDGKIITGLSKKGIVTLEKTLNEKAKMTNIIRFGNQTIEGKHTITITIKDNLANKKVTKEKIITIKHFKINNFKIINSTNENAT